MLDHYIEVSSDRRSPEAPIDIWYVLNEHFILGGAANVALNIVQLKSDEAGGPALSLIGQVGDDEAGKKVLGALSCRISGRFSYEIFIGSLPVKTTEKIRVTKNGICLARLDKEEILPPSEKASYFATNAIITSLAYHADAIVISDYAKGFITKNIASFILKIAKNRNIPVIVDTKPQNFDLFKNVSVITPNAEEAYCIVGDRTLDFESVGKALQKRSNSPILLTLGEKGMVLFEGDEVTSLPSFVKEAHDVTGAGDTVVAALSLGIAAGFSLKDAMFVANHAAAVAVNKFGTATVTLEELMRSMS